MASIQQLEKLYQIQRIFHVENSLEAAVAGERVRSIIQKTEQTMKQRAFLREERRRLRVASERLDERKRALSMMERSDWLPAQLKSDGEMRIRVNIGGLMFEVKKSILQRDSDSLLCKLCDDEPPVSPDPDGIFVFNRDWWLFRFILSFLRDGTLPDDRGLLAQLYKETNYWKLKEMQRAIEEQKLHLRSNKNNNSDGTDDTTREKKWWEKQPNWWATVNEAVVDEDNMKKAKLEKGKDWWTSSKYNGKDFLKELEKANKIVPPVVAPVVSSNSKLGSKSLKPSEGTWPASPTRESYSYDQAVPFGGSGSGVRLSRELPDPYGFALKK